MAVVSSCRVTLSAGAKALTEMVRQRCPVKLFGKKFDQKPKKYRKSGNERDPRPMLLLASGQALMGDRWRKARGKLGVLLTKTSGP